MSLWHASESGQNVKFTNRLNALEHVKAVCNQCKGAHCIAYRESLSDKTNGSKLTSDRTDNEFHKEEDDVYAQEQGNSCLARDCHDGDKKRGKEEERASYIRLERQSGNARKLRMTTKTGKLSRRPRSPECVDRPFWDPWRESARPKSSAATSTSRLRLRLQHTQPTSSFEAHRQREHGDVYGCGSSRLDAFYSGCTPSFAANLRGHPSFHEQGHRHRSRNPDYDRPA